ncbi:MAG TPA: hypothetical protein VMR51_03340 [Patescibacteria group bacterium]|nr:hypothetical protein [Patescibacteria group bacterium]
MKKEIKGQLGLEFKPCFGSRDEEIVDCVRSARIRGILKIFNIISDTNKDKGFAFQLTKQDEEYARHKRYHPISEKYPNANAEAICDKCDDIMLLGALVLEKEVCFYCDESIDKDKCFIDVLAKGYGYQHAYAFGFSNWFARAEHRQEFNKQLNTKPDVICMPFHRNPTIDK